MHSAQEPPRFERYIHVYIWWLLQSSSFVLSTWTGRLSLWIHQPAFQALLAGHQVRPPTLWLQVTRLRVYMFGVTVFSVIRCVLKTSGHYHCKLWRDFKHSSKRDRKKLSTPAWAYGVPPVRYLFQTQIHCWSLVCHLTTQSCSSVFLLI